ncbi:MAG: ion transporter [Candidatus Altiarchaeales archaeon]|nr:ion transporter [Candidatus Altiarchaeales archaeon]MBD3416753.1 ion transporter [Candidatus Altiarchaeales archaeon]
MSIRERVRFWFEDLETPMGKAVDIVVLTLIFLACAVYAAQNYPLDADTLSMLSTVEVIIGLAFTAEYLLRLWSAEDRVRHSLNVYSIIDLVAIMPVFLAFTSLQFLRVFRAFRIFRLLRFLENRHFFFGSITETGLIAARILFTFSTIVFVSASLILIAEVEVNSELNTFTDAVYFSVVTLTTVGFGDIVPLTEGGRLITLFIIVSGIIFIPWQLGSLIRQLIAAGGKRNIICRNCGLTRHDPDAVHCKHCGATIYQETRGA